jgi:hypothetical protein
MVLSRTPGTLSVPLLPDGLRGTAACLLCGLLLAACEDSPTDPVQGLVAEESYAALALGVDLPNPTTWEKDLDGEGAMAALAWSASWDLGVEPGAAARERVYGPLARALAEELDDESLELQLALLEQGLRWTRTLNIQRLPDHIAAGIEAAAVRRSSAREALDVGDRVGGLESLLRSADALRLTSPRVIAQALVMEAEDRFGRVSDGHPYTQQDLERMGRLVRGGRQALDEREWGRAIRRAYYAMGILEGRD